MIYGQEFVTFIGSKSLNLSFALNCVLKHANNLNDFKSTCFVYDVCQKFEAILQN